MRKDLEALISDKQLQEKLDEIENGIAKEIESLRISYLYTENDPLAYLSRRINESQKEIDRLGKEINTSDKKNQNLTQQNSQKDFHRIRSTLHQTELTKKTAQLNSLQKLKKLLEDQNEITKEQALRKATQAEKPSAVTPSSPEQSPSFREKIKSKFSSFLKRITKPRHAHGDTVRKIIQNTTTPKEKTISHLTVSRRGLEAEHAKIPTTTSLQRTETLSNNSESSQSFSRRESVVSQNTPKPERNGIATPDRVALQRTETLSNNSASRRPFSRRESVVSQGTIKPERNGIATQDWSAKQNKMDITKFLELLNPLLDAATKIEKYNKTKLTIEGEITALSLEKSLEHYKKLDDKQKKKLIESLRKHDVEFQCIYLITKVTGENNAGRLLTDIISQISKPIEATPTPINVSANQKLEGSSNTTQSTLLATTEITVDKDPKQPSESNEIQQPQQPKPIAVSSGYAAEKPRSRKRADSAPPTMLSASNKNEFLVDFSKIKNELEEMKVASTENQCKIRDISLQLNQSELIEFKKIAIEKYKKDLKNTTFPFFSKKESKLGYEIPGDFLEFSEKNDRAFKQVLAVQKRFESEQWNWRHENNIAMRANQQKKIAQEINNVLEKNISSRQIRALIKLLKKERKEDYLTIVREIVKIQHPKKDYEKQIRFCGFLSAFGLENFSSAQKIINETKNTILTRLENSANFEEFGLTVQENLISGMLVSAEKFKEKLDKLHESSVAFKIPCVLEEHRKTVMREAEYAAEILLSPTENNSRKVIQDTEELGFNKIKTDHEQFLRGAASSAASSVGAPSTLSSNVSTLFQRKDNVDLNAVEDALEPIFTHEVQAIISEKEYSYTTTGFLDTRNMLQIQINLNIAYRADIKCVETLREVINNKSKNNVITITDLLNYITKLLNENTAETFSKGFYEKLSKTKENLEGLKSPALSARTLPSASSLPTLN